MREGDSAAAAAAAAAAADAAAAAAVMNTRRFTWVLRDDVLYVTETGKAVMKDFMSKHAVLANGALFVRAAGELLFVRRADVWRTRDEVDAAAKKANTASAAWATIQAAEIPTDAAVHAAEDAARAGGARAGAARDVAAGTPAAAASAHALPSRPTGAAPPVPPPRAPCADLPVCDGAEFYREDALLMAGFTEEPDLGRSDEMVLVLDNESGTYGPKWFELSRAAGEFLLFTLRYIFHRNPLTFGALPHIFQLEFKISSHTAVLRNCGNGLTVLPLDYHDELLKKLKEGLCRM